MNTAARQAWELKNSASLNAIANKPKRQKRRRRRPGANRDCTTSDTAVELQRPHPQHISETPSHKTISSVSSSGNKGEVRDVEQISSHSPFNRPNINVRVSQHSSLDRDLYIAYQSSLSAQETPSLLLPDPNSGIKESSPPPTVHLSIDSNGIIPDSQSLPGSSSYRPTSSASLAVLGADQFPLNHRSRISKNSTDLESSTGAVAEADDSIEGSSAVVASASQPSAIVPKRSRSEPTLGTPESSSASPSGARLLSLPRSSSDPTSTYHVRHRRTALFSEYPSDHHIIHDQALQGSADLQAPRQTRPGHNHQRQRSSELQVPGSADRSLARKQEVDDSSSHSLVFQTQVPLAVPSQGSRVSITSAGTYCSEPIVSQQLHI